MSESASAPPVAGRRRRTAAVLATVLLAAGCGSAVAPADLVVSAGTDPESAVLAALYAWALRSAGAGARVESAADPLTELDSGSVTVVPGFTGGLLRRLAPGASMRTDDAVYRGLVAALPEGVAAGDYATAAEDKPALAVTAATATAWGSHDLAALGRHCAAAVLGARTGAAVPETVGQCRPVGREFTDRTALFAALRSGQVTAAWTTTADPELPADLTVLLDRAPELVQAENVVPLYASNVLTEPQVLAVNEVAGVLDTAALADLRRRVAAGADPGSVAGAWLAAHPLGR